MIINKTLEVLNLNGNKISFDGIQYLADALEINQVKLIS
jgi:hypothetical protein